MPIQFIRKGDSCGVRWGDQGHVYEYACGDAKARATAKDKALDQGYQIGEYKYSVHERFARLIKFLRDDHTTTGK